MMLYEEWCSPDSVFSSDSCLQGCGGFWGGKYFHSDFPSDFEQRGYSINILEMFAIIVCLKLCGNFSREREFKFFMIMKVFVFA